MAIRFQGADLIICRAGATTVAEITALGKAAIFIPYPYAADNHQMLNAKDLETAGAAEMISEQNLSGVGLAEKIEFYASNPDQLGRMEKTAKELGKPQAAKTIVDECLRILNIDD
jgi:UDP-N-acetylglucosamine--N-acetylmuramyl-(pentapeptide) pyrophosphoryl-undecaprenol N-acetylglucosamine transferase